MNRTTYHHFFTNLANSLKMDIILSLRAKEKCVGAISKELGVEQSKISHALASLRCCNIVKVRQKGKERVYSLNKKTIVPILALTDKHARICCNRKVCSCKDFGK